MNPSEFKEARLSLGLTQKQAAQVLGYSHHARVSSVERGERKAGGAVIRLLRAYLDGYRPKDWPLSKQTPPKGETT